MKCVSHIAAVAVLMSLSCATKKPVHPKATMVVTTDCVVGFVEGSKCEAISGDLARCRDVVMKIKCVKVSRALGDSSADPHKGGGHTRPR